MRSTRTQLLLILLIAAAAVATTLALHWPVEQSTPIYVRWASHVSPDDRVAAETTLGLVPIRYREGRTWEYTLRDPDTANVERLVRDPRVEDTHNIDRVRFRIASRAGTGIDFRVHLEEAMEAAHADVRTWIAGALVIAAVGVLSPIGLTPGQLVLARIGPVRFEAFVAFRVLFGLALAAAIWATPFALYPARDVDSQRAVTVFADWALTKWLAADSSRLAPIQWIAVAGACAFAAGLRARAALATCTIALTLLVLTKLRLDSAHDWGLTLVTLWGLVFVSWQKQSEPPDGDSEAVGARSFAVWFPGFMMGVGFLAAAIAKLVTSGFAWITTGAVRYHFVQDAGENPLPLALWIASTPWAAVAASAAGIAAEASVIVFALSGRPFVRLLGGLAATMLLLGFYAFQGVFWFAWWALLISFLPWPAAAPHGLQVKWSERPARVLSIVLALQTMATLAAIEVEPFLSNFPMYASTFESPAAFNARYGREHRQLTVWTIGSTGCGLDISATFGDEARAALAADGDQRLASDASLAPLVARARDLVGPGVTVAFELTSRHFDFTRGRFVEDIVRRAWNEAGVEQRLDRPVRACGSR